MISIFFIFLIAGASACPFAFQSLWPKLWFKIVWWVGMFLLIGGWFRSVI